MFKPGSIRKIIVKDFVTYSYVEMYPGPNLNMVIGPNGTGKSTIVAAIILGLGGNPKTVGRGSRISDYVKHNCREATIDIFLQSNNEGQFIHITRHFTVEERSTWSLNGKGTSFKDIEKVISEFDIQVDNLCQFLPQDRVQDFAKMNKQQLLQATQIAICRTDLINKQLQLIEFREKHKNHVQSMDRNTQKLEELHDANLRIEEKVTNLTKKKKYLKVIDDIERKTAWIRYENIKTKLDDIKADQVKASEVLLRHKTAAKPIENAISNAKRSIAVIQQKVTDAGTTVRQKETLVHKILEKYGGLKSSLNDSLVEMDARILEIDRRDQEITETTNQIEQLSQNKRNIIETHGSDDREAKIKEHTDNVRKVTAQLNRIAQKNGDLENTKRNKMYELRAYQNELDKLENVKQQRLEWLRRIDKHAYSAVQWLRSNRNMFKGEVFEPIMLELNVLNPKHAIFIENMIPIRDRIAFTCVLKEDMNMLVRALRDQEKLSVNVVHSGNEQPPLHAYQPSIPIEQLKKYGLYAYINTLVTGPEPIMKYLCKTYQIHNTPVGNNTTNQQFENVPPQITNFFSDTYRFSSTYSKYTGEKSTRQNEIKSDGSFSISVNAERMDNLRGQLAEVQRDCKTLDEEMQNLNIQVNQLNEKQNVIKESVRELVKCRQDIQALDSRIRVLSHKLQQLQMDTTSKDQIQKENYSQNQRMLHKMVAIQTEIKEAFKNYSEVQSKFELDRTNLQTSRKQVNFLENKSAETLRLCQQAEETVNHIKSIYTATRNDAKTALSSAKQLSNGFTPTDEGFNEFKVAYDKLTDDLEELQSEKQHFLSKIGCLNTADVGELQEYEKRKKLIEELQGDIEQGGDNLENINSEMDKLQTEWFEPLQEVVQEINDKFSNAFRRMGCAGDVSISIGDNEKDFAEYGLSIKVKYRDAEPLQELNNVVQSGGERAVATAAFMLSLQELTPVPFRCVDEINQGMDSNNERRVFELLLDATSKQDNSQYFFITPKLVPHLKFGKNMTIHFVHNGPFVANQKDWNRTSLGAKHASIKN